MQKWEYLFMDYTETGTVISLLRPQRANGKELLDWKREPAMFDHVNKLGAEGWELVHMRQSDAGVSMIFKRPKA